jgi:hypothetical protein
LELKDKQIDQQREAMSRQLDDEIEKKLFDKDQKKRPKISFTNNFKKKVKPQKEKNKKGGQNLNNKPKVIDSNKKR